MEDLKIPNGVNWRQGISEQYEFRTEVISSRDGTEQRIANRVKPRKTEIFQSLEQGVDRQNVATFGDTTETRDTDLTAPVRAKLTIQGFKWEEYWPTGDVWLLAGVGKDNLTIENCPDGQEVTLVHPDLGPIQYTVLWMYDDWSGKFQFRLTRPHVGERIRWPGGPYPGPIVGVSTSAYTTNIMSSIGTNRVGQTRWSRVLYDVDNPAAPDEPHPTYRNRPILLQRPNWSNPIEVEFITDTDTVDFGFAPAVHVKLFGFNRRLTRIGFMHQNSGPYARVADMFYQCKGMQRDFYAPTWTEDIVLDADIPQGTDLFTVTNPEVAEYVGDPVFKNVIFFTRTGYFIKTVDAIARNPESATLRVDEAFAENVNRGDIVQICWLVCSRFASDILDLQKLTPETATTTVVFASLPDTEYEEDIY